MSAPSRPVEAFLARLEGVRTQNGFYRAFCPAHDDRITPNLDIKEGEDGRVLLLCRAGCSTEEVVEALGLTMRDLFSSGGHGGGVGGAVSDPRSDSTALLHPRSLRRSQETASRVSEKSWALRHYLLRFAGHPHPLQGP